MTSRVKRACASALCLTIVLAASTANAGSGPLATPGEYSLTVYDPSFNVVYQVEQSAATINTSAFYELYPETSIKVASTNVRLPNITIFGSGTTDLQIPNALPTAIYAAGGNPVTGPWDAIFGLYYDSTNPQQTFNGNNVNYFLAFSAGPPATGTPNSPDGAGTYQSEASGPFFSATQYLNTTLQGDGYTAYFYDPASVPEPSSLTLSLEVVGAVLALAGLRRLGKARVKIA
jgi:hypothetical protein